jgi:CheY-like chemotaxis protein
MVGERRALLSKSAGWKAALLEIEHQAEHWDTPDHRETGHFIAQALRAAIHIARGGGLHCEHRPHVRSRPPRPSSGVMREPARVLLVLDEPILDFVKLTLNHGLYTTRAASTYVEVATGLSVWRPHLMILDHDVYGARFMERIQLAEVRLPVIVVTRRDHFESTLSAFDMAASDVLTVPFGPEELLARVIGLLRRADSDVDCLTPVLAVDRSRGVLSERRGPGDTSH